MPQHPYVLTLRQRRSQRSGDSNVLWKELDLILDLMEVVMESIKNTEDALAQLKADSDARDAATTQALTDLKAEVAALEASGVDTTAVNSTIAALDAAVKVGTSEAAAADPGAKPPQAELTQPGYTFNAAAEGAVADGRFTASGFNSAPTDGSAPQPVFYFSGDPANQTTQATGGSVTGYTQYSGPVVKAA
jgi:hypothetical protein